jgi:hypothetical protein
MACLGKPLCFNVEIEFRDSGEGIGLLGVYIAE